MLYYTGLLLLVTAVSLDGFGVGITYGLRKIKVPVIALIIIMLCSGIIVYTSMLVGDLLSFFISKEVAKILGGIILIAIGLFSFSKVIRAKLINATSTNKAHTTRIEDIKTVMTTPDKADLDQSGSISAGEAFLLGLALALDAFGAGIGASMLGYSPALTAVLTACMSGFFLFFGMKLGIFLSQQEKLQRLTFLPPVILIAIGIFNIF
ncbi:sporulation membrane protein YtaF [Oceanobacillus profundus]|uniref:Sporulation membrane protein YtaF n=1 Tax=Oceanobacillus profundus TaxID=372463 RepID=A0A417YDG8_9BACI|nr:sporulation membrane protein YtaF [Oceanobacillus profundus]RHW30663.1 sporulation membrane protein YtaF [Oceanobacillus profundus]